MLHTEGYEVHRGVLSRKECDVLLRELRAEAKVHASLNQSSTMWRIRTHPAIRALFASAWDGENDLIVGFDGALDRQRGHAGEGMAWHVDQDGSLPSDEMQCVQAIVALRPSGAASGSVAFLPRSHRRHSALVHRLDPASVRRRRARVPAEWQLMWIPDADPIFRACGVAATPELGAGDVVLWDSRTAHCVTPAADKRVGRAVAYVSMSPRRFASPETLLARRRVVERGEGTTHWPHALVVRDEPCGRRRPGLAGLDERARSMV